ncbi:MAG: hypothetical protein AB7T63_11075 [Planctomycetota bacterium]
MRPATADPDGKGEVHKMVDLFLEGEQVAEAAKLMAFDGAAEELRRKPKDMLNLAKVVNRHAERWRQRRLRYDGSLELCERIVQLATIVRDANANDATGHLAHAEALFALGHERINRHVDGSFDDHFGTAIASLRAAIEKDPGNAMAHHLRLVALYRAEGSSPGGKTADMLALAASELEAARKLAPQDVALQREAGFLACLRVRHLLDTKQGGPAKEAFQEAMALVQPADGKRPDETMAGIYNELLDIGFKHKIAPKKAEYIHEDTNRGTFRIKIPIGSGWSTNDAMPLLGAGETRILLEWSPATGSPCGLELAAFSWNTLYGSVGGDAAKGIFDMLQTATSGRLKNVKAKSAGRSPLPRWASKHDSVRLEANGSGGEPLTLWIYVWKSKEHMLTYGLLVRVDGEHTKDLPEQMQFVLGSLEEPSGK